MISNLFTEKRKSFLDYNETYFWTCTIKDWKKLLSPDLYKEVIIESLRKLVEKELLKIYGFVIMPNHIHLILKLSKPNGREKPSVSFLKDTAHRLRNNLLIHHPHILEHFRVLETDRQYKFWQRDSLAVKMFNIEVLEQKLNYIHNNPLQERWQLSVNPEDYYWSSAKFYATSIDSFGILTHYRDDY